MIHKKIINYPKSIGKIFETAVEVCEQLNEDGDTRLINLIVKADFPKGTLFQVHDILGKRTNKFTGVMFHVLLPSGEIYTGAAVKKEGDKFDFTLPPLIAAGRAIKVYKNNFKGKGENSANNKTIMELEP